MAKPKNNWRGIEWVKMIWNGTQSDPELIYKGIRANYWTIENYLYEIFIEYEGDNNINKTEKELDGIFNKWLKNNVYQIEDIFQQVKDYNIL